MKLYLILVALIGLTGAVYVTRENLHDKMRLLDHVMVMTDEILAENNVNTCLEKMLCVLETPQGEIDDANPWKYFSRFFTNTHKDFDEVAKEAFTTILRELPEVSKFVDAILLGQTQNDSQACHAAFTACQVNDQTFVDIAEIIEHQQQAEISKKGLCSTIKTTCSVVNTGCTICEVVTAGVCAEVCGPTQLGCKGANVVCGIANLFG